MTLRTIRDIALAAAMLAGMASCRTTEKNYRDAYEKALQKTEENSVVDGTIYDKMRREAINSRIVDSASGDTIPMITMSVSCVKGVSVPDSVGRYSVVVAQFKQVFNAKSMMRRLRQQGYATATVVQTAEPLYYVLAATCATPEEAAEAYRDIIRRKPVAPKTPYPCLFAPARYPLSL